ncbi:MAG: hypothetical protein Kow0065_19360 [Methylomicrobium sp.]
MKSVTVVRIYSLEGKTPLNEVIETLHDELDICGVSVFRAVEGFGQDRELRTTSLLSLSLTLPVVLEFYDETDKAQRAITLLQKKFDLPHIVSWPATAHISF